MKYIQLFLAICLFTSCSNKDRKDVIMITDVESVELKGDIVPIWQEVLTPREIYCMKDGFIIFDKNSKDGFLKYSTYQTGSMESYGVMGNGHNEYMLANLSKSNEDNLYITTINSSDNIVTVDQNKFENRRINFKNKNLFRGCNYLAEISKDKYLISSTLEDKYRIIDDEKGEIKNIDYTPFSVKSDISKFEAQNVIFESSETFNKKDGRMFVAYLYYPYCATIDIATGKPISEVKLSTNINDNVYSKNSKGSLTFENPTLFYTITASSNNCFWALYQSKNGDQLKERNGVSEIHKFSKDGQIIERIVLDRIVYHFSITPNEEYIYTLAFNQQFTTDVVRYNL